MRRAVIFSILALFAIAIFAPTGFSLAETLIPCEGDKCQACHLATLANNVIKFLIMMAMLLGAIFIMYAGFLLVTAQGNRGKIEEARSIFTDVVVGIVIILCSFLIVDAVMRMLVDRSILQGATWNDMRWACVPQTPLAKFQEKATGSVSVVPGGSKDIYAQPGSTASGADVPSGTAGGAAGAPVTDPGTGAANAERLRQAGVDLQIDPSKLDGVSQARIEQIATIAEQYYASEQYGNCLNANQGNASACSVQVSSGFRAGEGPSSRHSTGEAADLSGRNQYFNEWMKTNPMGPTFGGYQGATVGGGTCTYHPNHPPTADNGYHWHCSNNGF